MKANVGFVNIGFPAAAALFILMNAGCFSGLEEPVDSIGGNPGSEPTESEEDSMKEERSGQWSPELSESEKETLFAIARDTLAWCTGNRDAHFSFDNYEITDKLKQKTATFITLKKRGALRGCIGTLEPVDPLFRSIHANTVNAALNDFRFPDVKSGEIPQIDIHVSVLSPIENIATIDEFKLGEHGIILEKGRYRAVFLPEVAPEQGWDVEQTLSALSQKAGLSADGWREGANFKVFSSVVLTQ